MGRRQLAVALLGTALLLACGGSDAPAPESQRSIRQGSVVGTLSEDGRAHRWRGIPYAQAPVGPLRWRAPQAPAPWERSFEAVASGESCPQPIPGGMRGDEDCLTLDVYAPAVARPDVPTGAGRWPVMFWIHGGGNAMGSGNDLDPTRLAAEHEVVVVTINYRLGVFGWFSHAALRDAAEDPRDASGNFGTLDMIQALEWVRDDIAAFGGDPDNVTIFGESAGGLNVYSMLLSPLAKGLFHAAIAQSGAPAAMTRAQAENYIDDDDEGLNGSSAEVLVALLVKAGRAPDRAAAKGVAADMTHAQIEEFLRGHDTERFLEPFLDRLDEQSIPIYIAPNIFRDGHVIPDAPPLEVFATRGAYNEVPFIAGTNRDEHKLFFAFTSPHVSRTFGLPTGLVDERRHDLDGEYGGLTWRVLGVDEPLEVLRETQGPTVWGYRFDWDELPTVLGVDLAKVLGAAHGLDLPFVFGLTDLGMAGRLLYEDVDTAERLSAAMRSYWTHFAHAHVPGRGRDGDLPEWQPWSSGRGGPKYVVLDTEADGGIRMQNDVVLQADLRARVRNDSRLQGAEERCAIYRTMVQWSEALPLDEYRTIDDGACAAWPLASRIYFASLPE